jgi:hypothetical protein
MNNQEETNMTRSVLLLGALFALTSTSIKAQQLNEQRYRQSLVQTLADAKVATMCGFHDLRWYKYMAAGYLLATRYPLSTVMTQDVSLNVHPDEATCARFLRSGKMKELDYVCRVNPISPPMRPICD